MGKTPARNNPECWDNGNHKWVSISDMSSYARYTGDTSEYITDYAIADSGIKPVPKGTIIMSFKLSIGRTAITSEDIYTNEAIMAFADFDEKKFNIDFLHFLIANKNWLLGAKQAVKGQTLNKESIGNAKIIIPPIEMQEQFASIYNQADKSKFMRSKSQFIEMFGSKSSGDKWPIKYLSEIVDPNCPISYGIVQPGDELEDGVPIVRPVDLNSNYYVYKNGLKRTTEAISNSYKRTILRGDELLLCVRGTTGVMGLATEELKGGNVTRGITPLYFKDGFNRIYLLGAFLSDDVQAYIKDNTVGSTLKGINMERVRKIQIPIPPIECKQ